MELYHYGVDNQKWGVRRYQNPDGTYTPLGLMRKREKYSTRRSDIRSASDDDLREYTRRARLEAAYYDAARAANRTPAGEFWSDVARRSISGIITKSAVAAGTAAISSISNYETFFNTLNDTIYRENSRNAYRQRTNDKGKKDKDKDEDDDD